MHLSPRERDKLILAQVGMLAQRRLARGLRLNQPEAVGLIALVILELIRDGQQGVAELMTVGQTLLGRNQVMPGVAELISEVQVEGTFPDGTKLVTVHHPVCRSDGDMALALYGSFLPSPNRMRDEPLSADDDAMPPGTVSPLDGDLELNAGRPVVELAVTNGADRPIQVGSHYHFGETNPYLRFDRAAAYGQRLDIPAGTAVRFEPGETKTVPLVPIAGATVIRGGNNLADGPVSDANRVVFLERIRAQGFATT